MNTPRGRLILYLTVFGIGFGYIEAAVVVYLRALYYPDGFALLILTPWPMEMVATEVVREAATLLVLLSVALLSVRNQLHRFAVYIYCFGVWDLIYYLVLKLRLGWPASLLEWDILFLIPLPWTAPVLAPIIVSLGLITAGIMLLYLPEDQPSPLTRTDWSIEIAAGALILATFFWALPDLAVEQEPHYPWWLFAIGYLGGLGWFKYRWTNIRYGR